MPVVYQKDPDLDMRRLSSFSEPSGVHVVSVAVHELSGCLGEVIFHFCRSASAASRAGGSVLTSGTRQARCRAFQATRSSTGRLGCGFSRGCLILSGALGVRAVRLVIGVPIIAWKLFQSALSVQCLNLCRVTDYSVGKL